MSDMPEGAGADVDERTVSADARVPHVSASARAARALRQKLSGGSWAAGDRLPSEPDLAKELGVSRVSVRSALAQLQTEGLISRRHGAGTYVNSVRPLVRSLHRNVGSDELIRSRGHESGITGVSWSQLAADEELSDRLNLAVGTPVVNLHRVRTADGVPVTDEHAYFAASLVPQDAVFLGPSLYSFFSTVCGIDVTFGIATIQPSLVGKDLAPVFNVPTDELCLVIRQVDYDVSERPVSYSVEQHLATAFDFQLVRQGPYSTLGE